jgi:hypothetical protein
MTRLCLVLAALALVPVLAACPTRAEWQIETVDDDDPYVGSASIALDATGQPAVAYCHFIVNNESSLRYATRSGGSWHVQTLDSEDDTGHGPSLAFDDAGRPHIAYYTYWTGPLKYATSDGASWSTSVVQAQGVMPSMALDPAGRPRVAYRDADQHLRYAAWTGSSWTTQTVDDSGRFADISLALDGAGRPRIAYYDDYWQNLKYAAWTGSMWDIQIVDSDSRAGQHNCLALDKAGRPHISYYDYSRWHLKYASWTGSSWTIERVTSDWGFFGPGAYDTSLALDADDYPHICYFDWYDTDSLMYASWDGAAWTFETADSTATSVSATSLVLDAKGNAYICYQDLQSGTLRVAWVPEPATLALLALGALVQIRKRRAR